MNAHPDTESAASAVHFAVETLGENSAAWPEFERLLNLHYEEVAGFREVLDRLNFDLAKYQAMEKSGRLHLVRARMRDPINPLKDELVGYSCHLVYTHLHYKHVLIAEDDAMFIRPDIRRRGLGRDLRSFAISTLKQRGVKLVLARFKVAHPHDTHIQELGYKQMETVWAKVL